MILLHMILSTPLTVSPARGGQGVTGGTPVPLWAALAINLHAHNAWASMSRTGRSFCGRTWGGQTVRTSTGVLRRCFWTGACLFVGLATAGVAGAQPTNLPVRDYGPGFQKFYALGLPDVKGATYVTLTLTGGNDSYDFGGGYDLSEIRLKGDAWLLDPARSNQPARLVLGGLSIREVYDREALRKEAASRPQPFAPAAGVRGRPPADPRFAGMWQPADLRKDVEATLAGLDVLQADERKRDRLRYSPETYGQIFFNAAHYHRAGLTNEANRIVQGLFALSDDPRTVILQALNRLADRQYLDAFQAFVRTNDWSRYAADVQTVLDRYPAGWRTAPAVKRLADKLRQQLANPTPPPVTGEGLTAEDAALADELGRGLGAVPSALMYGYTLWVLPDEVQRLSLSEEEARSPVTRLCRRGLQAVPLLLALLDDETLTVGRADRTRSHVYYSSDSSDGQMSDEELDRRYNALQRPRTRGEVARTLLLAVLPRKEDTRGEEADNAAVRQEAKGWYEQNRQKSPAELARVYFRDGDNNQRRNVLRVILKAGTPGDIALVETNLLQGLQQERSDESLLTGYVSSRGARAADFVKKVEALLGTARKPAPPAGDATAAPGLFVADEEESDSSDRTTRLVETLKKLVDAKPLEEVLADVVKSPDTWAVQSEALYQQLRGKPAAEMVALLLKAAARTDNVTLRVNLLQATAMMRYFSRATAGALNDDDEDAQPGAKPAATNATVAADSAAWQVLLADTRNPRQAGAEEAEEGEGDDAEGATVAQVAAGVMEQLYGGSNPGEDDCRSDEGALWPEMIRTVHMARARARLAGTAERDLPAFPSASRVPAARRTVFVAELLKADAAALRAAIAALSNDEKLALGEEVEKQPALRAHFLPLLLRIDKVAAAPASLPAPPALRQLEGQPVNSNAVALIMGQCQAACRTGVWMRVTLQHAGGLGGWRLDVAAQSATNSACSNRLLMAAMQLEEGGERPARLESSVFGAAYASVTWPVTNAAAVAGQAPAVAAPAGADDGAAAGLLADLQATGDEEPESHEEYDAALAALLRGELSPGERAGVMFETQPAVRALSNEAKMKLIKAWRAKPPPGLGAGGPFGGSRGFLRSL